MKKLNYVGLDVHKKYVDATVLDEDGRVTKKGRFKYTREGFEDFFNNVGDAEVAMELGLLLAAGLQVA